MATAIQNYGGGVVTYYGGGLTFTTTSDAKTTFKVFGKPVTHGTRTQRAIKAKVNQNADGKLDEVMRVINQMQKAASGSAHRSTVSTTIGRVYNATGDEISLVGGKLWEGNSSECFPYNIQNGQWCVFEHIGTGGKKREGSVAAVVYSIEDCGYAMIAWNNPWKRAPGGNNTVYCEMDNEDYFNDCDWEEIHESLLRSGKKNQSSMDGYVTKVSIDAGGNAPFYSASFYLNV